MRSQRLIDQAYRYYLRHMFDSVVYPRLGFDPCARCGRDIRDCGKAPCTRGVFTC